MSKWSRRVRAAFGIGVIWGAAWFAAGMLLLLVVGPDAADVPFPLFFGLLGFLSGATFSLLIGLLAGRQRFAQLSLPRFAGWGALGGAIIAAAVQAVAGPGADLIALGVVFALAGAASASATLMLARRAQRRELPEPQEPASLASGQD